MTKQHLNKWLVPVRTAALVRFPKQMPKIWVVLAKPVRVLIINSLNKTIIASASGQCIEDAVTNLRRKLQADTKKAGT